jgi:hypothetical protein
MEEQRYRTGHGSTHLRSTAAKKPRHLWWSLRPHYVTGFVPHQPVVRGVSVHRKSFLGFILPPIMGNVSVAGSMVAKDARYELADVSTRIT